MPVHAVLPRSGKKDGKEPGIEGTVMMEEKKAQLDKVRRAFRNPDLRNWIPNYLLTVLEQGEDTEATLAKRE